MKKLFKTLLVLTSLSTALFIGCKKDSTTSTTEPESNAPTLLVNNGTAGITASALVDTINLSVVASADTNRKIKKMTITRAFVGELTKTLFTKTYDAKDLVTTYGDPLKSDTTVLLEEGKIITYTVIIEDDKGKTAVANYKVTIQVFAASGQIFLGGPSSSNDYHFLGTSDNFQRYRAGSTGVFLAKDNSAKIDFIFFFGTAGNVQNAIYSPDYDFGTGNGWNTETSGWPIKNKTVYVATNMTASQFDALNASAFNSEVMNIESSSSNWTVGAVNKVANLAIDQVIAFKKSNGRRGFIKIANPATNASGQLLLLVKSEL